MKTLQSVKEKFIERFSVWNQKYKFAEKPCVEHKPDCFCDVQEWTPPEVADWWLSSLKELLEQVVPEEKRNLITKKRRLTYSDVDDAYNLYCQEVEERIKKIIK